MDVKKKERKNHLQITQVAIIMTFLLITLLFNSFTFSAQAYNSLWERESHNSATLTVSVKFQEDNLQSPSSRFSDPIFNNPPQFIFHSDLLKINVINPTVSQFEPDTNIVDWTLSTNGWNVNLDFESIGNEGESYGNLIYDCVNEFFKYTISDDFGIFGSFSPGGGLYGLNFDGGTHLGKLKIEYNPAFSDKPWCAVRAGEYRDIIMVTISGEPGDYRTETVFGGDTGVNVHEPNRWWYYFDIEGDEIQNIWAGQDEKAGTVWVRKSNNNWEINIYLDNGWQLMEVEEAVKIKGYQHEPEIMPPSGQLNTYKGNDLQITFTDDNYKYFIIHLDLIKFY